MPETVAIAGLGSRGLDSYAVYQKKHPDEMKITAAADLRPFRLEKAAEEYAIAEENCFSSAEEMLSRPPLADCLIIATQDQDHVAHALMAIRSGYRKILLEKPVSPVREDCLKLLEEAQRNDVSVTVCHVLRYTPFYQTIKKLIDEGRIGRVFTIDAVEAVGYFHMAHSFVRGNWRSEKSTSPMILQKSCHDMDIIRYLADRPCRKVYSTGSLSYFRAENAPAGFTARCLDPCPYLDSCPFSCKAIYIDSPEYGVRTHSQPVWPTDVVAPEFTLESVENALRTGPYGRCVFACDNTVVDHQIAVLSFDDDIEATFTMTAFSEKNHRTIRIFGSEGEIEADTLYPVIKLRRFDSGEETVSCSDNGSGHGGGDEQIVSDFLHGRNQSSLAVSLESHMMCFACEQSRLSGKAVALR